MVAARATKARAGGSGRAATPQAANQSTSHLASIRFLPFLLPDWRLCLRPIFGISARFSLLFGFPFWKTHLGAFCHLSRILIENRRGAQCQMWVIICHVCIDLDDRKEGGCGVLHDRKVGNSVIGMIGKGRGRKDHP